MKNFIVKSIVRTKDADGNEQIICHSSVHIKAKNAEDAIGASKQIDRRDRRVFGWDPNSGNELIAEETDVDSPVVQAKVKLPANTKVSSPRKPKAPTKKAANTDKKVVKSAAKVAKDKTKTDSKPATKTESK